MIKRLVPLAILLAVAAVTILYLQPDPAVGSCIQQVDTLKSAFEANRPRAKSQTEVESAIKRANELCREKRFDNAAKAIKTADTVCRQNKGCEPQRK